MRFLHLPAVRRLLIPVLALLVLVVGGVALWSVEQGVEEGLASWYGGKFQGRRTASGEVFDTNLFTAAHKTLPFGTVVRVTNLETGRSTVVRINDRGPFVPGRIIDLSRAAAAAIGMAGSGVARVRVEVIPRGGSVAVAAEPAYVVQLGAFRDRLNAEAMRREARSRGFPAEVERGAEGIHRVILRHVPAAELEQTRRRLAAAGWTHILARLER
jgi:rare lipoprotein A